MHLKTYYPFETYAVLLTLEPDKAVAAVREAKRFGVEIGRPDVNASKEGFTVDWDNRMIRFGLEGIDGVGPIAAKQVIEFAPYETLLEFDLKHSMPGSKCNRGHRQALLAAGALDSLGGREDWTEPQKASTELDRLGMSLRVGGTFGIDEEFILTHTHSRDEFDEMEPDARVVVAGRVLEAKRVKIKSGPNRGKDMAHVRIGVGLDQFDLTLFYRTYAEFGGLVEKGNGVIVVGKRDESEKIIVTSMMDVGEWLAAQRGCVS